MKNRSWFVAPLLLVSAIVLTACDGPQAPPEDNKKGLETAKKMREYFDKAGGDYGKLTGVDKDEFVKLAGGKPEEAEKLWNQMKYGPSGAPVAPGASPTSAPKPAGAPQ